MFLIGVASTGIAVPARTTKAAADTKEFLRLLKIIIRSFSLFCSAACSTSRNGNPNVDVAPNSIGIGADFVGRLNQLLGLVLIDSCDRDRECRGQHKAARFVATETNFGNDFDVSVRKSEPGITPYA